MKYQVLGERTEGYVAYVEAESPEAAREIAESDDRLWQFVGSSEGIRTVSVEEERGR